MSGAPVVTAPSCLVGPHAPRIARPRDRPTWGASLQAVNLPCEGRDLAYSDAMSDTGQSLRAVDQVGPPDVPYPPVAVLGAGVATLVAPFLAVPAALLILSDEKRPARRAFLKTWAAISAGLIVVWFLVVVAIVSSSSAPHGCQGGIDQIVPPDYVQSNGGPWQAVYTCMNGGQTTTLAPPGSVPTA